MTTSHYKTVTPLATWLPLAYTPEPKQYKFVLCAKLAINLVADDLVIAQVSGQASTVPPWVGNAMHGRYLKATTTTSTNPSEGISVSKPMATNVDNRRHHSPLSCGGSFMSPTTGVYNILFVMYAASLGGATDSHFLKVDYVDLDVAVVHRDDASWL